MVELHRIERRGSKPLRKSDAKSTGVAVSSTPPPGQKKLLAMSSRASAAGVEERVTRMSGRYVARTHAVEGEAELFFTIRIPG
jgi:hypothetical protein